VRGGLEVTDLVAGYGSTVVLDGVSLRVEPGGALAVLGRNGVGKTTLLATIMGFTSRHSGTIKLGDRPIHPLPTHRRARFGLGYVAQDREIFPSLTVKENLAVSALPGGWAMDRVFELFPALKERQSNTGNRLSGGEQQMLAIARALVGGPKLLLLDEPLEGLAPIVVEALLESLARIRDETRVMMILVEQKADLALSLAEEAIVLARGRIVYGGNSADLQADEELQNRLLAVAEP
jgi:branched-chain amino acid transport system ATP-binding protein